MDANQVRNLIRTNTKEQSPLLLTIAAAIGTCITVYLAAKAGYETAKRLDEVEELEGISDNPRERFMDRTRYVWKLYIPTGISAAATIGFIVGAHRVGLHKTVAAQTALVASQRMFSDYRKGVIEEFGERKDQAIRDQVAQRRVLENPPPAQEMIVAGSGTVLCSELETGRYLQSDMETLRRAQNDINQQLFSQDYATLDDFYYIVGLSPTTGSSQKGWRVGKPLELTFTAVMTEDKRPCIAFAYNYLTTL